MWPGSDVVLPVRSLVERSGKVGMLEFVEA